MAVTLHPLSASDAPPARALADAVLGDAPFAGSMLTALEHALRSSSDEYRAIVARDVNAVIGVIVFGETAGALGAGRIYFVAVASAERRRGIGTALVEAACNAVRSSGGRFVMMELAEEPWTDAGRALARRTGFRREGGVPDYARDGVHLVLLRRDLDEAENGGRFRA
ncbi:MAG TPA: GNAT family N-acetyltransferase [Gemmatimonadaceae bacterium]|nr:GNAT family N-acetyltransferase [Gemmatimonadaceae bacterium]